MHSIWWKRLGWLILIWTGSVGFLFVVAFFFRCLMLWAGLKT